MIVLKFPVRQCKEVRGVTSRDQCFLQPLLDSKFPYGQCNDLGAPLPHPFVGATPETCVGFVINCVIDKERVEWISYEDIAGEVLLGT